MMESTDIEERCANDGEHTEHTKPCQYCTTHFHIMSEFLSAYG